MLGKPIVGVSNLVSYFNTSHGTHLYLSKRLVLAKELELNSNNISIDAKYKFHQLIVFSIM